VTLEILDAKSKLVRRYASTDEPAVTEADLKALEIPEWWVRKPRVLPAGAGMHRWVWDLHYAPPETLRHEYPIAAVPHETPRLPLGPRALPGVYTVKLTAGGKSLTARLTVKMDPRVKTPAAGIEQQFEMERKLASMMTRSAEAIHQARAVQEQIEKLTHDASGPVAEQLAALQKKIQAALAGGPAETTLATVNGQASALYGDVDSADAAPTAAQVAAMDKIGRDFPGVMTSWSKLTATDITELNRQLKAAKLPEIQLNAKPAHEEEADDSDDVG